MDTGRYDGRQRGIVQKCRRGIVIKNSRRRLRTDGGEGYSRDVGT